MNSLRACSDLYGHAEHTGQELTCTLSVRVRNWCINWAHESGTGACTEHTPQILMHAQSAFPSKHAEHTHQELMRTLSIRVRNWCVHWAYASGCLAPPKIKIIILYFSPKVTYPERLYGVKIMRIRAIKNLTLGHLYKQKNILNHSPTPTPIQLPSSESPSFFNYRYIERPKILQKLRQIYIYTR